MPYYRKNLQLLSSNDNSDNMKAGNKIVNDYKWRKLAVSLIKRWIIEKIVFQFK